jgi:hypothetical protein
MVVLYIYMRSHKGLFKPRNPGKYKGDPSCIVYRSSWELRVMQHLDTNPNILEWMSDVTERNTDGRPNGFAIPYISPVDSKWHRYYPDFLAKVRKKDGTERMMVLEIKPEVQTRPPKKPKKQTKRYLNECMTWGVNQSKWLAAKDFCENRGWEFVVLTESHLGIK